MDYERIHKLQSGLISPSKLRMKLMGPHHSRKKDGSNSNSSRTSPSRLDDDTEFVKNSLLDSNDEEVAVPSVEGEFVSASGGDVEVEPAQLYQTSSQMKEPLSKENGNQGRIRMQQFSKGESTNSSAVHPMRLLEDENLDYDSNASSSSFEFHKERNAQNQYTRSFTRPMPSKWNDAEKWIMNRQNILPNYSKKNAFYNQANRMPGTTHMGRVAPEAANLNNRTADTKRIDFCQPTSQLGFEKFSFIPPETPSISGETFGGDMLLDQCTQSKDLAEVDQTKNSADDSSVVPGVRSVCMRDMGTEMTPVPSQEPSRTATPVDATTPFRSPTSSIPSTPRRREPTSTPAEHVSNDDRQHTTQSGKKELTEEEMKLKTRREIVALGVRLGKMNIAAWASKEDQEKNASNVGTADAEHLQRIEYEKRAAAWDEAEKCKHAARYKREEIKIQAWESQQRAKLEAEMRKIEARVEQMKAQGEAKMVKKIAMMRQRSEEKRAAAEEKKRREAQRTAAQGEYIRKTGKMPTSSSHYMCCGWL
ncbi:Remorin family protein [Euphorbia peplus]|nr:Remorin family protein [Euphorbia peplus]